MKQTIWYRADNPEKNKIYVWKSVKRVIHEIHDSEGYILYEWIKWKNHKWVVKDYGGGYQISYQI